MWDDFLYEYSDFGSSFRNSSKQCLKCARRFFSSVLCNSRCRMLDSGSPDFAPLPLRPSTEEVLAQSACCRKTDSADVLPAEWSNRPEKAESPSERDSEVVYFFPGEIRIGVCLRDRLLLVLPLPVDDRELDLWPFFLLLLLNLESNETPVTSGLQK